MGILSGFLGVGGGVVVLTPLLLYLGYSPKVPRASKLAEHVGFKTATFCTLKDWKDKDYETAGGKAVLEDPRKK